jgi:hypothetical protein
MGGQFTTGRTAPSCKEQLRDIYRSDHPTPSVDIHAVI